MPWTGAGPHSAIDGGAWKGDGLRVAVRSPFATHDAPRRILRGSGEARLLATRESDSLWWEGGDGRWSTRLGHVLMSVRDELRVQGQA